MPLIRVLRAVPVALISPLISADPLPDAWQRGWHGFTIGLALLGIFWLAFEAGYYAGTQEERAFWAPLEAAPRKWPRLFRPLLHVWQRLADRSTDRRGAQRTRQTEQERRALLAHSGGRHRSRLEEPGGLSPVGPSGPEHVSGPARQHRDREEPG